MKKIATIGIALLVALLSYYQQHADVSNNIGNQTGSNTGSPPINGQVANDIGHQNNNELERAIEQQHSDVLLTAQGTIKKTLSDDNNGSRHQRFLVELPSGHTILVAHNIDLAERVPDLQAGDPIELHGEYVWNERGGLMHWTHRDPAGRHAAGWIKHNGHVYQ